MHQHGHHSNHRGYHIPDPRPNDLLPQGCTFKSRLNVREAKNGQVPSTMRPKEVGCYHIDSKGDITVGSKQNFRKFHQPSLPFDLNAGIESFVPKKDDTSLRPILHTADTLQIKREKYDFISFRNNFNKIMETPYSRDNWAIRVVKEKGTIYFHIIQKPDRDDAQSKMFSYYGYKFEEGCTEIGTPEGGVDPNVQFCSLVELQIGEANNILLGAEIDCYLPTGQKRKLQEENPTRSQDSADQSKYIEIKTSRIIDSDRTNHSFLRYKLLKFWIQSHLAGVPSIFCGFRDDSGFVRKTQEIRVEDIPGNAAGKWHPADCVAFTQALLEWVKRQVVEGEEYVLSFSDPYRDVELYKMNHKTS